MTPSQARNSIKKCLKTLIDPKPKNNEKDKIWAYFKNECAYCGVQLTKESRIGHIDHLYSEMEGGSNRLSNLVLTCATCNGDEKRELEWEDFLSQKCGVNQEYFEKRKNRILRWIDQNEGKPKLSDVEIETLAHEFKLVNFALTESVDRMRKNKM